MSKLMCWLSDTQVSHASAHILGIESGRGAEIITLRTRARPKSGPISFIFGARPHCGQVKACPFF